jgi:riboflavin kinase/FMN adenylyltransferase
MLTAAYRIRGTVIEGARRGRTIGFPTANLAGIATLLPADGVYAARALIAGTGPLPAAVHIGPNVSFGETAASVEVHVIGWSGNLYGSSLDVDFLDRLRETRRFASVDEVKKQLALDVALASSIAAAT